MEEDLELDQEKKILYDLFIPCKWPETTTILPTEETHSLWRALASLVSASFRYAINKLQHPLSSLGGRPTPPSTLINLISARIPWQLAINSDGSLLAVLKEDELEIRSIEEEFETVVVHCRVERDPIPQWRKIIWSQDSSLLAVGTSYGGVSVFTQTGRCVCNLPGHAPSKNIDRAPLAHAVAGLIFLPPQKREGETSVALLSVLHYGGTLDTYQLRHQGTPVHLHSFSFQHYYPHGVASMVYHSSLNILIVGSCPSPDGSLPCVSGWRLLDGSPYWTSVPAQQVKQTPKKLFGGFMVSGRKNEGLVFGMSVSPNGSLMASIDVSGRLCLWEIPSFRLRREWRVEEMPTYEMSETPPPFVAAPKQRGPPLPLEVNWWSDKALILVNTAREVTVPSISSLCNLLGDSAEPGSCITAAHNGQFLMLECESHQSAAVGRYRLPSFSEDSDDGTGEGEFSLSGLSTNFFKQVLYLLTESDRFRPPTKKPKILTRQYSLACLKSLPPEECYEKKLQQEEYGEALLLAQQYGLDCDLVHQRQWQNNPITMATIQDYLSKVTKQQWVLQECLGRVPEEYVAARELLQYGLVRTSFKELKEAGSDEDESAMRGSLEQPVPWEEEPGTTRQIEREIGRWKRLAPEQVSICQFRHKLLTYLDRLCTYEVISNAADEPFDCQFFQQFRSYNLVLAAINYARDSDWRAVETLFTYHGNMLLPHRLAILSNFPETTHPRNYKALLPALSSDGGMESWELDQHRELDWVETAAVGNLCSLPSEIHASSGRFIYEENPHWLKYESPSSGDVLTEWFTERATEIEEFSGQVDNALGLVELGMDRGVKNLNVLHHQLLTLHTLVYQSHVDNSLNLNKLQQMTNLEVVKLMMREFTGEEFILAFCQRVVPFLKRVDRLHPGERQGLLEEYLTSVAKDDLLPCLAVFQQSKGRLQGAAATYEPVVKETKELMSLALKCIYTCDRSGQLEVVDKIEECLPHRTQGSSKDLANLHNLLDTLEDHLHVADVLNSYGVHKPIHYIRDIQDNAAEAENLMVKLTRVASRQRPHLSEAAWRSLLQRLLSLRTRVFSCVDQNTCYRVFTESLLCSGLEENIELASQLLTLTPTHLTKTSSTTSQPPGRTTKFTHCLPYDVSLQLVLSAAREYFNSASDLSDTDMDRARHCLGLFGAHPPPAIQAELNLIASLAHLDDFGVTTLPVQVRLCENRLDIIRKVLDSSPTAYRRREKILKLAHLLGLDEGEESYSMEGVASGWGQKMPEGHGCTVILVAMAALERGDLKAANVLCSLLIAGRFPAAWEVCRKLALQEGFSDLAARMDLINFALTHCPPEEVTSILKERGALEVQTLSMRCQSLVSMATSGGGVAVQHLVGRGVQQIVSRSAGAVQHLIRPRSATAVGVSGTRPPDQVIEECVHWLQEAYNSSCQSKESLPLQLSYHPFYVELLDTSETRQQESFSYGGELKSPSVKLQLALSQALLRAVRVANTLSNGEETQECSQVLLHLAEEYSQTDTPLLLGYLLSLSKPEDADKLLSKLVPDKLSLQLSLFYTCLQLYSVTTTHPTPTKPHPYLHPPLELVDHVTNHVTSIDESDWPEDCQPLLGLLRHYRQLLADHTQADVLQSLGLGIDVQQFTQDPEYKHDTILSLARTSNSVVFTTALSLAKRHTIPEWDVYMSLLDWLLTDQGLSSPEVQRSVTEMGVMKILLQNPQQTADRLRVSTFLKLPGNKYRILELYYSLLQQCVTAGAHVDERVDIDTHLKLLKKFKPAIPGLDYKSLMSGVDPLAALQPVLDSSNVHVVAKLASKIPYEECGTLTAGMVFSAFAEKLFWTGDGKHPRPTSTADWVHRYEGFYDYLNRLNAEEFYSFVCNVALSDRGLQLSLETRCELVKRAVRFSHKKMEERSPETRESSFENVNEQLQNSLKHLLILNSPELATPPPGVTQRTWTEFIREFDLSISQPDKVHVLVVHMMEGGVPVTAVSTILSLAQSVHEHNLTVRGIVQEALETNLPALGQTDTYLEKIQNVLSAVSQHESEGGTLVASVDVLEVLRPYCSGESVPCDSRMALLRLMEKHLYLSQEDMNNLHLYQTQSILSKHFATKVSIDDVSSSEHQEQLLLSLLEEAESVEQFIALSSLLKTWPHSSSTLPGCWVKVLKSLAGKPEGAHHVVVLRAGVQDFPSEEDHGLYAMLWTVSPLEAMKLALVSAREELLQKAFQDLKRVEHMQFDADLFELVILREQVPNTTTTAIYSSLCGYLKNPGIIGPPSNALFAELLCCTEDEVCEKLALTSPAEHVRKVAKQLYSAGLKMEAGSLLLSAQVFHTGLQTVNSAVAFLSRMFQY